MNSLWLHGGEQVDWKGSQWFLEAQLEDYYSNPGKKQVAAETKVVTVGLKVVDGLRTTKAATLMRLWNRSEGGMK